MFGIFLDVTQRKQSEEAHELLGGEMSHRVKKLLAMAAALTTITSRSATTAADMARQLTRRLTALGRAHELVQPKAGQRAHEQKVALLGDLLSVPLAPYGDLGTFSGRVRVSGPKLGFGEAAATTLALVVHELATNSFKYSSLSAASGTLDISCTSDDDDVVLIWIERGGPSVIAPAEGAIARTGLRLGWPDPEIASARANGERLGNADHAVEDLDGDCNFALLAIG